MKKILISALIILLIVMACFAIFKGLSIAGLQILSVEQIAEENDKLTLEIAQTEKLMKSDYPAKTSELNDSISKLLTARDEYLDLASVSTEGELKKANQEEEYTVEFLLTRLGRHTTAEGVNLNYTISAGTTGEEDIKNISFTVSGNYIPIIEFVSAIEDDSKLGFRIQNFKLVPGGSNLQATFSVSNVRVKPEIVESGEETSSASEVQQDTDVDPNAEE